MIERPSVNFRQLSVRPRDFLSTSVNFLCVLYTFLTFSQFPSNFVLLEDHPSTSVYLPCQREIFRQLPAIFLVAWRPSLKFREHFVRPVDIPGNFRTARRPSVIFRQLYVWLGDIL